ncbi:hypothetical protein BGW38_001753 [Lunasporangiospora selenospora]|uniref:Uncharacterized protein n=1 Tax=Lunasporangiospora selenospora TaxID=979761 RepID=A0A9P6FV59_9FUNG|nr:hypothetical protein BGW38_001753 [Lunasporangiospora selenospora]
MGLSTDPTTPPFESTSSLQTTIASQNQPLLNPLSRGLNLSPTFKDASPLLAAIHSKDQEMTWMVYSALKNAGQLGLLLPLHHSLLLRSIRILDKDRFTQVEAQTLTERFEHVWDGMREYHVQPDMNDYTARLEFYVNTRQYLKVDQTWKEIRQAAEASTGVSRSGGAWIQPTLYTYNLVIASCVPRKQISLALDTINRMRRAGIKPDNMSWDYILKIHCAMNNWSAVESTFRLAFDTTALALSTTHPSPDTETSPLKTTEAKAMTIPLGQKARSLHGGRAHGATNPLTKGDDKLTPSLENIHTLFSYYACTQDLDHLRSMFDSHVRLFGLVPTTKTYNEMIKFAFMARRSDDALELFWELESYGLEPSDTMFRRTLASMKRCWGDEEKVKALTENWDQVRARRVGMSSSSSPSLSSLPPGLRSESGRPEGKQGAVEEHGRMAEQAL